MKATATELARDTANILARTESGRTVEIKRRGKTIAVLQKRVRAIGRDLIRALKNSPFTDEDSNAIKAAIDNASKALEPL
jgi:antitoxin (DNA-binding transcriptional repressor) of toxin-antitoxin stability system